MPEFEVDGQQLTYETYGEGAPVLTVCNAFDDQRSWPMPVVPELNEAGYRVITYKYLGGPKPSTGLNRALTVLDFAAHTVALLDHLAIEPVRLWGYSMGALMAQEIALSRPDLVAGAVLMATRARLSAFETLQLEAFYSLREVTEQHPAVMAYLSLPYYVPLSGEAYSDDEVMAPIIEMLRQPWPAGNHEAPKEDEDWHDYGLNYEDRRPALSGISVPCMVLAFELDGCTFPRLCREVAETIPRCQYAEIVGAGHLGASTHRAEVLEAVLPFFDSFADAPS